MRAINSCRAWEVWESERFLEIGWLKQWHFVVEKVGNILFSLFLLDKLCFENWNKAIKKTCESLVSYEKSTKYSCSSCVKLDIFLAKVVEKNVTYMTSFIMIPVSRRGKVWQGRKCLCVKWDLDFVVHPKFICK